MRFLEVPNSGKSQILRDIENCLDKTSEGLKMIISNYQYSFQGNINDEVFVKKHFKKINKDKYNDSIKYFDVEQGNDYVDLHYIKSDHDTVKNVLDQIMKEKIEKKKATIP